MLKKNLLRIQSISPSSLNGPKSSSTCRICPSGYLLSPSSSSLCSVMTSRTFDKRDFIRSYLPVELGKFSKLITSLTPLEKASPQGSVLNGVNGVRMGVPRDIFFNPIEAGSSMNGILLILISSRLKNSGSGGRSAPLLSDGSGGGGGGGAIKPTGNMRRDGTQRGLIVIAGVDCDVVSLDSCSSANLSAMSTSSRSESSFDRSAGF